MSAPPRLTARDIEALACPSDRRDMMKALGSPAGFCVRVTRDGAKTYLLQYRWGGAVQRLQLGRAGEVSLADARKRAEQARGLIAAGRDPVGERKVVQASAVAARADRKAARTADAMTLERLAQQWLTVGLKDRSPAHRRDAPAALERSLPAMWKRPVHAITVAAVQKRIDDIGAAAPEMARRVRDYGRACLNWGARRGLVTTDNPFAKVVIEGRAISRDRVLTDAELGAVWLAATAMAFPFGPLFRVLLLTLQRREEVAGMRWPELAPDFSLWTLPASRAKNRKAHVVHLAAPVRAILAAIPRRAASPVAEVAEVAGKRPIDIDLVFSTTGRTAPSGFSKATDDLRDEAAELMEHDAAVASEAEPWRLHDFRRSGVTVLARRGIAPHVADRVLNHVEGTISGVAAVYQRHQFLAERAAALDLWAEHVMAVAAGVRAAAERRGGAKPAG